MSSGPSNSEAPFLYTTRVFETKDPDQLRYTLTDAYADIANGVNAREISAYDTTEIITGQVYLDPANPQNYKPAFRTTYYIGTIGTGATVNTPTGLTGVTNFINIQATIQFTSTSWGSLPYVDTTSINNQISFEILNITGVQNIQIISGSSATAAIGATVVLEYLKS